ncbi:YopX family protein [Lysinibacillus capsici]|uniref:YopX family protein n=1 Tax=Lysinibacillus capsici TaxID=2115968 RepID=UPI002FDDF49E
MSREIKFRVWLKGHMVYITPDDDYFIDGDGRLVKIEQIENGCNYQGFEDYECLLMQFTGLKDKNGKEIFEGDIVQQNYKDMYNQNQAFVGEVVYSDCVYWLKNGGEYTFLYDEYRIYESIVIGNIYENPELLEGTA